MDSVQTKSDMDCERISPAARMGYVGFFSLCVLFFLFFFVSGRGMVRVEYLFGVCGFYQKTGVPCPGCFVTRSIEAFSTGHFWSSFVVQPAGFIICIAMVFAGLFSLLAAIRGVDYGVLRVIKTGKWIFWFFAGLVLVLGIGWAVTLTRELTG